jgi:hypothetical protein
MLPLWAAWTISGSPASNPSSVWVLAAVWLVSLERFPGIGIELRPGRSDGTEQPSARCCASIPGLTICVAMHWGLLSPRQGPPSCPVLAEPAQSLANLIFRSILRSHGTACGHRLHSSSWLSNPQPHRLSLRNLPCVVCSNARRHFVDSKPQKNEVQICQRAARSRQRSD